MKRFLIATILVAALATAGLAGASNGKSKTVVASFSESYAFSVDCREFGDYDFENLVAGDQKVRVTDIYQGDELVQTVLHIVLAETNTNSETGKTVRLSGAVHETWDYAAGTRIVAGKVWMGKDPDGGKFVQDTGRIVLDLDTNELISVAGPHEAFFAGGIDPVVCRQLAA